MQRRTNNLGNENKTTGNKGNVNIIYIEEIGSSLAIRCRGNTIPQQQKEVRSLPARAQKHVRPRSTRLVLRRLPPCGHPCLPHRPPHEPATRTSQPSLHLSHPCCLVHVRQHEWFTGSHPHKRRPEAPHSTHEAPTVPTSPPATRTSQSSLHLSHPCCLVHVRQHEWFTCAHPHKRRPEAPHSTHEAPTVPTSPAGWYWPSPDAPPKG